MLKVAILSDIHAYSRSQLAEGEGAPSWAEISNPSNPAVNPFAAVLALISKENLTADVLVSGGDLGDKASPQALNYAWHEVRGIQAALGAKILLAATGNHDMDSREINGFDARGALQELDSYPLADERLRDAYWANNAIIQEHPGFRSVLLNSAAYHGYAKEWAHGRVSARTRAYLRSRLTETSDPGLNILVTHHHLYPLGGVNLTDHSEMEEAPALLELLSSGEFGSWLVIHGHRHWPSVSQASGGQGAPIVFSAGSFSAMLYDEIQDKARNQFYLLEIEDNRAGHRVRGTFKAWDWISDEGFRPAQARSGLPSNGGFGGAMTGAELADAVAIYYTSRGHSFVDYQDVVAAVPDLRHAMPADVRSFETRLRDVHSLAVLHDDGTPVQIGKRSNQ
jgi:hypothetical protein